MWHLVTDKGPFTHFFGQISKRMGCAFIFVLGWWRWNKNSLHLILWMISLPFHLRIILRNSFWYFHHHHSRVEILSSKVSKRCASIKVTIGIYLSGIPYNIITLQDLFMYSERFCTALNDLCNFVIIIGYSRAPWRIELITFIAPRNWETFFKYLPFKSITAALDH